MRSIKALPLAIALCLAAPAMAQETTSSIRGKLIDASGQPASNTTVVVEDLRTGVTRTYTTSASGSFLATRLAVGGPYKISAGGQVRTVDSIGLGDIYNLSIDLSGPDLEEVIVVGTSTEFVDVAAGPAATFSITDLQNAVAFERDITDVYAIDPRINLDGDDRSSSVNCAGKHPRFNSVTLDGVSQNDRFGLNTNGYATATGMPFPYDGIEQVAVELAPFDVTYGGFSACNINAVTKQGTNEWNGNVFYEYTEDSLRGDELEGRKFIGPSYDENKLGFSIGGPILKDRLFIFAAYEDSEEPRFLSQGFAGSGNGTERDWLDQATFQRVNDIAQNVYGYDTGDQPSDGAQENEKYMVRLDWNINDNHNAALIYNYFDGFQDRASDGDSDEFEFANHFYRKGAESETTTLKLASQWTDAFSTELFYSISDMNDSQVTVGPKDFGDHQISVDGNTIYLGADDSRQANRLFTESDFFKIAGQYLAGDHVISFGYESEDLKVFNQFVQHSNGGEYDYFDDSPGNPEFCAALSAQGRLDDADCSLSGIDRFELGRPSRIYYGSGGGTNNADDAAASFTNTFNSVYIQDEIFFDQYDLTIVGGLRYDFIDSDDRPNFNPAFTEANGIRNDSNLDGIDLLMPRLGFTWGAREDLTVRGGVGLYSGGNPTVWVSNAWSNDGVTNVQLRLNNFGADRSVLDGSIPLTGSRPGFDIPQELFDQVAGTTTDSASTSRLVIIDPNYEQPSEWKFALGATWDTPWWGITADVDYLHSEAEDPAYYVDLSQDIVGTTAAGTPIYDYVNGQDNFMLTNSSRDASSDVFSLVLRKEFDSGVDVLLGYAYTDADDISPMTSSVAGSNFDNTALLDINDPRGGTSNYVVPHRLTLRTTYSKDFFPDLYTRFSMFGYANEGQPQSYVMQGVDLEGDGFFGRHLLYVPTGASDPNVVFDPDFDQAGFFDFVSREGLGAGFTKRNGQHAGWTTRFDFRVDQELPTFIDGTRGRAFFKMYNVGNFLNDDWGVINDAEFFSQQVVNASIDDQGRFVYTRFSDRDIEDVQEQRSLWEARIGLEFEF